MWAELFTKYGPVNGEPPHDLRRLFCTKSLTVNRLPVQAGRQRALFSSEFLSLLSAPGCWLALDSQRQKS